MSREERRNYERMMKNMERGPALPPGARQRAERKAARRSQRTAVTRPGAFSTRFLVRTVVIAVAIGFLAFSFQWPNMPFAAYLGVGVGVVALAVAIGLRLLQRRAQAGAPPGRGSD